MRVGNCCRRCLSVTLFPVVAIIGNQPQLGEWDTTKAVLMKQSDQDGTLWEQNVTFKMATAVKYKYCVVHRGTQRVLHWETIPGNRFVSPGVANVCRGRPTTQSSTYKDRSSSVAVNGNVFGSASFATSTQEEAEPWWEVDLEAPVSINQITVWMREGRFDRPVVVTASLEPFSAGSSSGDHLFSKLFNPVQGTGAIPLVWRTPTGPEQPIRFIRVQAQGHGRLQLAEVQAYALVQDILASSSRICATAAADAAAEGTDAAPATSLRHTGSGPPVDAAQTPRLMYCSETSVYRLFSPSQLEFLGQTPVAGIALDGHRYCVFHEVNDRDLGADHREGMPRICMDSGWLSPQWRGELRLVIGSSVVAPSVELFDKTPLADIQRMELHVEELSAHGARRLDMQSCSTSAEVLGALPGPLRVLPTAMGPIRVFHVPIEVVEDPNLQVRLVLFRRGPDGTEEESTQPWLNGILTGGMFRLSHHRHVCAPIYSRPGVYKPRSAATEAGPSSDSATGCVAAKTVRSHVPSIGHVSIALSADDCGRVMGQVAAEYTIIRPFIHPDNTLRRVWRTYWRSRPTLHVGHRGVGRSFKQTTGFRKAAIHENTILSFLTAAVMGTDMIEFDVMLSQDRVPVVYHDFHLEVALSDAVAGAADEAFVAAIHQLSARQLGRVRIHHLREGNSQSLLARLFRKHWQGILQIARKQPVNELPQAKPSTRQSSVPSTASSAATHSTGAPGVDSGDCLAIQPLDVALHDMSKEQSPCAELEQGSSASISSVASGSAVQREANEGSATSVTSTSSKPERHERLKQSRTAHRLRHMMVQIPHLRDLFERLPPHLGFDVEIKYPISTKAMHLLDDQAFDLNVYLDTILECIFDYAGDRRILFSCFHPEICVALRAKQARYPVLYLTEGGMNAPTYTDVRCRSLDAASEFVIRERLQGVATDSRKLLENPDTLPQLKAAGLLVFTWGDWNTDPSYVAKQRAMGVDAVISDNIGDHTRMAGQRLSQFMS